MSTTGIQCATHNYTRRHRSWCAPSSAATEEGGRSASTRRSHRLARQGRTQPNRALDLLLEKEARVVEMQRQQEQQVTPARPQIAAVLEQLLDPRQVDGGLATGTALPANIRESDYSLDPKEPQLQVEGQRDLNISRQSEALLAILQAGEHVEEVIAQHRSDIDDIMLQLLVQRMQTAEQLEQEELLLQGLQLMYRRLKGEIERSNASPGLRLMDEVMSILDGEGDIDSPAAALEERRAHAASHLRAAFSGNMAGHCDVLSLAAQLSASGGDQLADTLVADPVDPVAFIAEATELLRRVEEQRIQLEAYLEQQRQEEAVEPGQAGRPSLAMVEQLVEQRQAAVALAQEGLQVAQAVVQQLG